MGVDYVISYVVTTVLKARYVLTAHAALQIASEKSVVMMAAKEPVEAVLPGRLARTMLASLVFRIV